MADDTGEIGREAAEAVGFSNIKVIGEGPAFYQNQAMGETLANTQAMNQLRMTLLGKIAESVIATSPAEGGADTALMGILTKLVQGTPPPTNLPTQGQ
jgi:hypothetical protein